MAADPKLAAAAAAKLAARPEFILGEPSGRWLPVAVEGRDERELWELHDWVVALPGVEYLDVAHVSFGNGDFEGPATMELKHEH